MKPATDRITFQSRSGATVSLAVDVWRPRLQKHGAVLFMPGFGSVRSGEKALAFAREFVKGGFTFVAFEPRGHGASSGDMEGLTLDRHLEDLRHAHHYILQNDPRPVAIGSSLGALTMAAFVAKHAGAFRCLVGVGSAFGFLERWSRAPRSSRPPGLTDAAIQSARNATSVKLGRKFKIPALLWHGMKDDAVDWRHVAEFAAQSKNFVELRMFNQGDHRLTDYKYQIARDSLQWVRDR